MTRVLVVYDSRTGNTERMALAVAVQGRNDNKHYGPAAVESPNKKEIESCKELGERVAKLATALEK